jgi:hypothetical protein
VLELLEPKLNQLELLVPVFVLVPVLVLVVLVVTLQSPLLQVPVLPLESTQGAPATKSAQEVLPAAPSRQQTFLEFAQVPAPKVIQADPSIHAPDEQLSIVA